MMTYKKTLFFIGKCLTINHEEHNKTLVETDLKSGNIDWDAVVKVSTAQFVFPALYCNLKRANFLHFLPEELVSYMIYITDINRERNQQIIKQAKEINEVLLANNITPIFLKGTGNLLEGLYEDIGERMVGDIDFIVSKTDFKNTVEILENQKYKTKGETSMEFHWHHPKMVNKKRIAAVEVHKRILKKDFDYLFDFSKIETGLIQIENITVLSTENKILNAILPKIINDNLYHSQNISIRTMYDVFLISQKEAYTIKLKSKKTFNKFNNFCGCIQLVLNSKKSINIENNSSLKKFTKNYITRLENPKKRRLRIKLIHYILKQKDRFIILTHSFYDKEYRNFTLKRLKETSFYLKHFSFNKT